MGEEKQSLISNKSEIESESEQEGAFNDAMEAAEKSLKVYPQRYMMAVLYSGMQLAVSFQLSMYTAQAQELHLTYGVSKEMITASQLIPMLFHFPLSFPANFVVDKYGIRTGLWIAGICLMLGSWIRCLVNVNGEHFWLSIVGAVLVGIANPFIINGLNKVSGNWFYPADRPKVTSFLSFFSTVSGLVGIILPGFWFNSVDCETTETCNRDQSKAMLNSLSITLASMVSVFCIPTMILFKDKPPTPPSLVDGVEREDFKVALKVLAKDKVYILQSLCFAIFYGSFQDLAANLSYALAPFGIGGPMNTGIISGIPIVSGIFGSVVIAKYLAKTQKFRRAMLICNILSIVSMGLEIFFLSFKKFWLLIPPTLLLGLGLIPMIPTLTEWACETSYPIGEPTITGFIWAIAHIFAGTTGFAYTAMLEQDESVKIEKQQLMVYLMLGIMFTLFCIGFVVNLFIKGPLKRLEAEKQKALEKSGSLTTDSTTNDL